MAVVREKLQNRVWICESTFALPPSLHISLYLSVTFALLLLDRFFHIFSIVDVSEQIELRFYEFSTRAFGCFDSGIKIQNVCSEVSEIEWKAMWTHTHTQTHRHLSIFLGMMKQYHWISKSYGNQRLYKYFVSNDIIMVWLQWNTGQSRSVLKRAQEEIWKKI